MAKYKVTYKHAHLNKEKTANITAPNEKEAARKAEMNLKHPSFGAVYIKKIEEIGGAAKDSQTVDADPLYQLEMQIRELNKKLNATRKKSEYDVIYKQLLPLVKKFNASSKNNGFSTPRTWEEFAKAHRSYLEEVKNRPLNVSMHHSQKLSKDSKFKVNVTDSTGKVVYSEGSRRILQGAPDPLGYEFTIQVKNNVGCGNAGAAKSLAQAKVMLTKALSKTKDSQFKVNITDSNGAAGSITIQANSAVDASIMVSKLPHVKSVRSVDAMMPFESQQAKKFLGSKSDEELKKLAKRLGFGVFPERNKLIEQIMVKASSGGEKGLKMIGVDSKTVDIEPLGNTKADKTSAKAANAVAELYNIPAEQYRYGKKNNGEIDQQLASRSKSLIRLLESEVGSGISKRDFADVMRQVAKSMRKNASSYVGGWANTSSKFGLDKY